MSNDSCCQSVSKDIDHGAKSVPAEAEQLLDHDRPEHVILHPSFCWDSDLQDPVDGHYKSDVIGW